MTPSIELRGGIESGFEEVLDPDALEFVAMLQSEFAARRGDLLQARARRRERLAAGESLAFLAETRHIRQGDWKVAPPPADMQQRWIEITGPTDRKLTINALNSGADGFMADFEDANAPTWHNMVQGHINLRDAIERTITYHGSDGRHYELREDPATLLLRPRGWHLPERHLLVDSEPVSGSLFDFGMYFFHSGPRLLKRGLEEHGYAVDVAYDGEDGLALATAAPYDVLVLDIMLPKLDGLSLCNQLRAQKMHMPVLMLTARDAVDDARAFVQCLRRVYRIARNPLRAKLEPAGSHHSEVPARARTVRRYDDVAVCNDLLPFDSRTQ